MKRAIISTQLSQEKCLVLFKWLDNCWDDVVVTITAIVQQAAIRFVCVTSLRFLTSQITRARAAVCRAHIHCPALSDTKVRLSGHFFSSMVASSEKGMSCLAQWKAELKKQVDLCYMCFKFRGQGVKLVVEEKKKRGRRRQLWENIDPSSDLVQENRVCGCTSLSMHLTVFDRVIGRNLIKINASGCCGGDSLPSGVRLMFQSPRAARCELRLWAALVSCAWTFMAQHMIEHNGPLFICSLRVGTLPAIPGSLPWTYGLPDSRAGYQALFHCWSAAQRGGGRDGWHVSIYLFFFWRKKMYSFSALRLQGERIPD